MTIKESIDKNQLKAHQALYDEMDFSCQYSDNLPAIFKQLNISVAFTSYQAGRLMLVRSDGKKLDVNFKSFTRPMGLSATEQGLTLGIFTQVMHFQREDGLLEKIKKPLKKIEDDITAPRIKLKESDHKYSEATVEGQKVTEAKDEPTEAEKKQRDYDESLYAPVDERVDACFITRASHYTGMINIHDIGWGDEGLWAVNSSFSCLCTIEPDFSFVPHWKPHFISELVPEDRCHLNGMTLRDGKPAYVTTFSTFNEGAMWRKSKEFNGTLMDVASNEILVDGLAMPHSPRWYRDKVYFCNSGEGQVCTYDPATGQLETIIEVPGFTRGIAFYGQFMLLGLSRVRASDVTSPAPLAKKYEHTFSGVWLVNLDDNSIVGSVSFTGNVDQIYDVAVLADCSFPEIIEPSHPRMRNHFCYPPLSSSTAELAHKDHPHVR
ncbi:MAG: TIGR03032 family protein [Gammaproteobacteria bacterium]|nr:MAG: TIGR03032 family protein [Gammaproteobacteria bacterium]